MAVAPTGYRMCDRAASMLPPVAPAGRPHGQDPFDSATVRCDYIDGRYV